MLMMVKARARARARVKASDLARKLVIVAPEDTPEAMVNAPLAHSLQTSQTFGVAINCSAAVLEGINRVLVLIRQVRL